MTKKIRNKSIYGEKLAARRARRNGRGSTISIPYECVDIRYNRYIDRNMGIITLIPESAVKAPEEKA